MCLGRQDDAVVAVKYRVSSCPHSAVRAESSQHFVGSDHHLMIRSMDN